MKTNKPFPSIEQVQTIQLPRVKDARGSLTYGEYDQHLPFIPKRYFVVFDVPGMEIRGEHAHKRCHQFLICITGACAVIVDDGQRRAEINLATPDIGLYLPPMVWGIQYKFTTEAMLLVLASHPYQASDYIRDYNQYLAAINKLKSKYGKKS